VSVAVTVLLAALLPFSSAPTTDSTGMLVGRVADATDSAGVAGANVQIVGTSLTVRTDGRGMFRLRGVPAGPHQIEVRAFRYSPDTVVATFIVGDSVRVQIYMHRLAQLLSEMVVQGRAMRVPRGFETIYARGARGWGTFTAEDAEGRRGKTKKESSCFIFPLRPSASSAVRKKANDL